MPRSYYPPDYEKSRDLAQISAKSGSSIGMCVLANFHVGIPQAFKVNKGIARKMYRCAASLEDFNGMLSLAISLFDDPMFDEEVFSLLKKVERSNWNPSVHHYLGLCFETGKGCNLDLKQALYQYTCLERSNCRPFFECRVSRIRGMIREVRNASKPHPEWRPDVDANGWPSDLFDSDNDETNGCICELFGDDDD
jgi:hypothetical protein